MIEPTTQRTDFNCPHCGAHANQTWFKILLEKGSDSNAPQHPQFPDPNSETPLNAAQIQVSTGKIFTYGLGQGDRTLQSACNLNVSQCFNCKDFAVWVFQSLLHPPQKSGPAPNADLDADIIHDIEEARSILQLSPRGAAGLLRLALQKLCKQLGEPGQHIDTDIKNLVRKGLSADVQKALDTIRIIGNESVHPGTIDIRDDPATAMRLIQLINIIAQQMISNPKAINELYNSLPATKLAAIAHRDK